MTLKDPLAEYRRLNIESQVEQASPHRLIQLLFDGATGRLQQATVAIENNNIAEKGRLLSRVLEILATLRSSLELPESEIAIASETLTDQNLPQNLDALYDYCQRRLLRASIDNDVSGIDEVLTLLLTVKSAWEEISPIKQPG